jgi:hypothetical protein
MSREFTRLIAAIFYSLIGLIVLISISCGGGGGGDGGGTPPPSDNFGTMLLKEPTAAAEMESSEKFWTRERIQKAMENPLDRIIDLPSQKTETLPESTDGTPKRSSPFNPDGINRDFIIKQDRGSSVGEASSLTCPASDYETGYFPNYWQYPERTQGMLAIRKGNVLAAVCSATLIGSNIIMTAAHCVADSGEWYSDWAFVPGFNASDNWKPYGIGFAKYAFIYSGWFYNSYFPADVAFIVLKEPLGDQTGWLGIQVNQTRDRWWTQVGYPAVYPYEWVTLAYNISSYGYDECRAGTPCLIAVGSSLTPGSSGGPWVMTGNYVNGLNSFSPSDCPSLTMISPYFGDKIWDLYNIAKAYQ